MYKVKFVDGSVLDVDADGHDSGWFYKVDTSLDEERRKASKKTVIQIILSNVLWIVKIDKTNNVISMRHSEAFTKGE